MKRWKKKLREIEIKVGTPNQAPGRKGFFHRWTVEPFFEHNGSYVTKTYALIELTDGDVLLLDPEYFKFVIRK